MVDLERQNGNVSLKAKQFSSSRIHCFEIVPNENFRWENIDFHSVVCQITCFVPKNVTGSVKLLNNRILMFEFARSVRIKLNRALRGDCCIQRIRYKDMLKHLDVYEILEQTCSTNC